MTIVYNYYKDLLLVAFKSLVILKKSYLQLYKYRPLGLNSFKMILKKKQSLLVNSWTRDIEKIKLFIVISISLTLTLWAWSGYNYHREKQYLLKIYDRKLSYVKKKERKKNIQVVISKLSRIILTKI